MELLKAKESDYLIFLNNAKANKPLDVHTPYTYWAIIKHFHDGCFYLKDNDKVIGSIMSLQTNKTLFVWQIGIVSEYRKKGLSYTLYEAVYNAAKEKGLSSITLSIDPSNENSYYAILSFCNKNNLKLIKTDEVNLQIQEDNFKEFENLYTINI